MGKLRELLEHPEEIWPMIQMLQAARRAKSQTRNDADLDFCYGMLNAVSRRWCCYLAYASSVAVPLSNLLILARIGVHKLTVRLRLLQLCYRNPAATPAAEGRDLHLLFSLAGPRHDRRRHVHRGQGQSPRTCGLPCTRE